jgi:hypothetical protein
LYGDNPHNCQSCAPSTHRAHPPSFSLTNQWSMIGGTSKQHYHCYQLLIPFCRPCKSMNMPKESSSCNIRLRMHWNALTLNIWGVWTWAAWRINIGWLYGCCSEGCQKYYSSIGSPSLFYLIYSNIAVYQVVC